jgi:hypothetical protein
MHIQEGLQEGYKIQDTRFHIPQDLLTEVYKICPPLPILTLMYNLLVSASSGFQLLLVRQ